MIFRRYVKLLIVQSKITEKKLYNLFANAGLSLERIHPVGKVLEGVSFHVKRK